MGCTTHLLDQLNSINMKCNNLTSNRLSLNKWIIQRMWYVHTVDYYSAKK